MSADNKKLNYIKYNIKVYVRSRIGVVKPRKAFNKSDEDVDHESMCKPLLNKDKKNYRLLPPSPRQWRRFARAHGGEIEMHYICFDEQVKTWIIYIQPRI